MIKLLIKHLLPRVYEEIGQEYYLMECARYASKVIEKAEPVRRELTKTRNLKKVSN